MLKNHKSKMKILVNGNFGFSDISKSRGGDILTVLTWIIRGKRGSNSNNFANSLDTLLTHISKILVTVTFSLKN